MPIFLLREATEELNSVRSKNSTSNNLSFPISFSILLLLGRRPIILVRRGATEAGRIGDVARRRGGGVVSEVDGPSTTRPHHCFSFLHFYSLLLFLEISLRFTINRRRRG
uniref:Uncharacterized protein MANES_16G131700 n=1 Tax=Rhizophora mucronata TaxID=61149 RepID=A0A2P2LP26_RHIMU